MRKIIPVAVAGVTALGLDSTEADLSTSRGTSIGRQGLSLAMDTQKSVTIDNAGKTITINTTASDVARAPEAAKITVYSNDELSVKPSAPLTDGARFTYTSTLDEGSTRVGTREPEPKAERQIEDPNSDNARASSPSSNDDTSNSDSSSATRPSTTSSSQNQAGTNISTPVKSSPKSSAPEKSSPVASGGVWDKLAQCEAGGNWAINIGNGFYGGLQFTPSTWKAYGGSGLPHQASREAQIAVGKMVQAGQGWGAWPACTYKLGIR